MLFTTYTNMRFICANWSVKNAEGVLDCKKVVRASIGIVTGLLPVITLIKVLTVDVLQKKTVAPFGLVKGIVYLLFCTGSWKVSQCFFNCLLPASEHLEQARNFLYLSGERKKEFVRLSEAQPQEALQLRRNHVVFAFDHLRKAKKIDMISSQKKEWHALLWKCADCAGRLRMEETLINNLLDEKSYENMLDILEEVIVTALGSSEGDEFQTNRWRSAFSECLEKDSRTQKFAAGFKKKR